MIFDAIAGALLGVLRGFLSLMPEWIMPAELSSFGTSLGTQAYQWNGYFPIATMFVMLGAIVTLMVALTVFRVGVFIWRLLPFT